MDKVKRFIAFDSMITPFIIQIFFWISVGFSAIYGIIVSISGIALMFNPYENDFLDFYYF